MADNDLNELEFNIPNVDTSKELSLMNTNTGRPWNPQPDFNKNSNIDKQGYEKQQSAEGRIEPAGAKGNRKVKKQSRVTQSKERPWGPGRSNEYTVADQRSSQDGFGQKQHVNTTTMSQQSNYAGNLVPQANNTKSQNAGATVQINNPISIYHVYFTQQSQRASLDLQKKLEPFEKSYIKYQKKMMQAQNQVISPTTGQNVGAQNNRYATDYSGVTSRNGMGAQGQIYKSGSVNSPFDAPLPQEQDALTLAEEDQKANAAQKPGQDYQQQLYIQQQAKSDTSQIIDQGSRGRSLPPLRQNLTEFGQQSLLQQNLIKDIKKRNKLNAKTYQKSNQQSKESIPNSRSQAITFQNKTAIDMINDKTPHTKRDLLNQEPISMGLNTIQVDSDHQYNKQNLFSQSSYRNQLLSNKNAASNSLGTQSNSRSHRSKGQVVGSGRVNVHKSLNPAQNRGKINSPYSNKYNDEYYRLAQIAQKHQNQFRQSSQLPQRDNRFYTIDASFQQSYQKSTRDDLQNLRVSVPEHPTKLPAGVRNDSLQKNGSQTMEQFKKRQSQSRNRKDRSNVRPEARGRKKNISTSQNNANASKIYTQANFSSIQKIDNDHMKIHDGENDNDNVLIGDKSPLKAKEQKQDQLRNIKECFMKFKKQMTDNGTYKCDQKSESERDQILSLQLQLKQMQDQMQAKDKEILTLKQQVRNQ